MNLRQSAYQILYDIFTQHDYANLSLRKKLEEFSERDKALITQIVYGTLQNYRYLRFLWSTHVSGELAADIAVLLDMTAYQLLFLDKLPAYAVINEAVEISKKINHGKYQKLVNAVSHKLKDTELDFSVHDEEELALKTSHPDWLVRMWVSHYGYKYTKQLCFYNNTIRKPAVRVNTLLVSREELLQDKDFHPGKLAANALYYDKNILSSNYYQEKKIIIQDEASQYIGEIISPKIGSRILDACSAPGTKAIQLAMMMNDNGYIAAVELYPHRAELIKNSILEYNVNCVEVFEMDARQLTKNFQQGFDIVLVDAPCSGLGTLRHKPDIKIRIRPEDIDELVQLQHDILVEAAKLVKKSGELVYASCTVSRKENEKQIAGFLAENNDFELLKEEQIDNMKYETDGFYYAKLRKKETT